MKKLTYIERIKQLRIEEGITQTQLANELNMSQSSIAYWEAGKKVPNANAIIALAQYFGVTTDYLLGITDN